ncbi:hypothetical protein Tco_1350262 [Tanacetum coccineum]
MRISGFMHGVNNPELTKRLNEHVPNTMEEMMITTTTFIRGEAVAAGKKKGHASWRAQNHIKSRHASAAEEVTTAEGKLQKLLERVNEITFPSLTTSSGTEGPLVIEAEIGGHMIHRMLLVTIGDANHSTKAWMNFMIVRSLSPYNVTIRSTILIPAECATVTMLSKEIPKEAVYRHENFKVALHLNFPDQEVAIGGTLSAKGRTELCSLLKENLDIFAWKPSDMTGVPRSVVEHRLNIWAYPRRICQDPELAKAIQAEILADFLVEKQDEAPPDTLVVEIPQEP